MPEQIDVNEFRERSLAELLKLAEELPIRISAAAGKSAPRLRPALLLRRTHGTVLEAEGILEQAKENYAIAA